MLKGQDDAAQVVLTRLTRGNSVTAVFYNFPCQQLKMAHVVSPLDQPSNYKDSQTRVDRQKQNELLAKSTTLYVGGLTLFLVAWLVMHRRLVT